MRDAFRGRGGGLGSGSSCQLGPRRGGVGTAEVIPRDSSILGFLASTCLPTTKASVTTYWLAHWSISEMVTGSFSFSDQKYLEGFKPIKKAYKIREG